MKTLFVGLTALLLLGQPSQAAPKKPKEPPPVLYLMSLKSYPDARIEGDVLILVPPIAAKFGERNAGMQVGVEHGSWKEVDKEFYLAVPQGSRAKIFFDMTFKTETGKTHKVSDSMHSIQWAFDGKPHRELAVPLPGEKDFNPTILIAPSEGEWIQDRDELIAAAQKKTTGKPSAGSKKANPR